ncbi:MAG: hypothetical protein MUF34_35365 [Polyangiaceae bacterium]|nr:hypothetical protein [Polyangiaceae bacterium]
MFSRQLWLGAFGAALVACGPPPPTPSRVAAEAKGRCAFRVPEARADAPLEPRNSIDRVGETEPDPFLAGARAREGFFALTRPPLSPSEGEGYPLELRLRATPVLSSGQAFGAALTLVNRSRGPLTLARPIADGGSHLFQPYYDLYLRPEGSFRTFAYISLRDALACDGAATGPGSYFTLAPGESTRVPVHWAGAGGPRLLRPGRYVLWAVYRFCAGSGGPGAAPSSEAGRGDVLRGEYATNPVSIEVR